MTFVSERRDERMRKHAKSIGPIMKENGVDPERAWAHIEPLIDRAYRLRESLPQPVRRELARQVGEVLGGDDGGDQG